MAFAGFDLAYTRELAETLQHPHWRVRFLGADVVNTMLLSHPPEPESLSRNVLPAPLAGLFLSSLSIDPNPDVRARAADVIRHLNDSRTVPALLILLDDGEWFVRLHATRALAKCRVCPLEALGRRLTDTHWRVREAAARAISARGPEGVNFLLSHFQATDDRYSREQVVEQLERTGLIPSLLAGFEEPGAGEEPRFIGEMVGTGNTAVLRSATQNAPEHGYGALAELQDHDESKHGTPRTPAAAGQVTVLQGGRQLSSVGREEFRRA